MRRKIIFERQQGFLLFAQSPPALAAQKHDHEKAREQDTAKDGDGECFHGVM
jgi:hypothetical protein